MMRLGVFRGFQRQSSSVVVRGQARRVAVRVASTKSQWGKLGLIPSVVDGLESVVEVSAPSEIQNSAIPAILGGEDVMFAAETGSGKTLAYLAPVFSMLKAQEEVEQLTRVERRPRCLVLVPTRELAMQVLGVAKQLSKSQAKLTCRTVIGGGEAKANLRDCAVDVVVASPGRFLKLWHSGDIYISRMSHVVVDEADTILSQGWGPELREILKATMLFKPQRPNATRAQLILTTATLTPAVRDAFTASNEKQQRLESGKGNQKQQRVGGGGGSGDDRIARRELWSFVPPVRVIESKALHRTVSSLRSYTVSAIGKDKMKVLVDYLEQQQRKTSKTMVFCNTVASCRAADFAIREAFGIYEDDDDRVLCYHGEMMQVDRQKSIEKFRQNNTDDLQILVCTDLAARGLDLPSVSHVLNFDYPRNPIDFLHRAGRTARFGSQGSVTSLVSKQDRVLAAAIDRAIASNMPLDGLTGSKRDYQPGGKLATPPEATTRGAARIELSKAGVYGGGKKSSTTTNQGRTKASSSPSRRSRGSSSPPDRKDRKSGGGGGAKGSTGSRQRRGRRG